MPESTTDNASKKSVKINRGILNTILLVLIVLSASIGGSYYVGFKMGQKSGAKLAVRKVTDLFNPLNAVSDNPLFPHTVLGKVTNVSNADVTVKMANGEEKKVPLTNKTKVTKQDKVLAISDIKKDSQVTIFTVGKGSDTTANRVVLR